MKHRLLPLLICLFLAACGNCEVKGNNAGTRGGCSIFNTGF
ncbi:hypothetical protein CCC_02190 [Paramagnetospirillum magnetotacticum MS-1]|uniref:Lipoprotein n=1 Tax=Paramagnetospirillum magnetotacticum MS-1 TaxID=272627 RepID=A0A0C2YVK8_PARME|nr:hypothetical protein [Paramagnetospirillum magnetotacticum]KIL98740.1 hypothetical protein CCC_02190 [Paramagnetospirillum magnetotacticum MS-1]